MNNKRTISNIFRCNRFYEPMIPGGYLVKFRFKDEIAEQEFEIEPGDCYQTLLELCNGFCEGYGYDGDRGGGKAAEEDEAAFIYLEDGDERLRRELLLPEADHVQSAGAD